MKATKTDNNRYEVNFNVNCTNHTKGVMCDDLNEYMDTAVMIMNLSVAVSKQYEIGGVSEVMNRTITILTKEFMKPLVEAESHKYTCDKCPFKDLNNGEHLDMIIRLLN